MKTGNSTCSIPMTTCGLTNVQTTRNNMNPPSSRCETGRPRNRRLPHKRKTAEMETQHCLMAKMTLPVAVIPHAQAQGQPERIKQPGGGPDGEVLAPGVAVEVEERPTSTHTLSKETIKAARRYSWGNTNPISSSFIIVVLHRQKSAEIKPTTHFAEMILARRVLIINRRFPKSNM